MVVLRRQVHVAARRAAEARKKDAALRSFEGLLLETFGTEERYQATTRVAGGVRLFIAPTYSSATGSAPATGSALSRYAACHLQPSVRRSMSLYISIFVLTYPPAHATSPQYVVVCRCTYLSSCLLIHQPASAVSHQPASALSTS